MSFAMKLRLLFYLKSKIYFVKVSLLGLDYLFQDFNFFEISGLDYLR